MLPIWLLLVALQSQFGFGARWRLTPDSLTNNRSSYVRNICSSGKLIVAQPRKPACRFVSQRIQRGKLSEEISHKGVTCSNCVNKIDLLTRHVSAVAVAVEANPRWTLCDYDQFSFRPLGRNRI